MLLSNILDFILSQTPQLGTHQNKGLTELHLGACTRTLATALFGVGEVEAWFSITERWKGKIHPAAQTNIMEFKPLELRVKSEKQKEIWTLFDMYTKQQHTTLCKNTYKQKDAC